jgi:hypothetical protein
MQQVARSWSVAVVLSMERIDEDVPCDVEGAGALYVRSQSCVGGGEAARRAMRGHVRRRRRQRCLGVGWQRRRHARRRQ